MFNCKYNLNKSVKQCIRINFDILEQCASKVRLVGAHKNALNTIYTKENELLNDMPYYVDNERQNAIWFDGTDDWFIGDLSNSKDGYYGDLLNVEHVRGINVECPTDTNTWIEWIDGEWITNRSAKLYNECCSNYRLVGAHNDVWNTIYTKETELLNDMPYYVDNERRNAIWFDGVKEWNIGSYSLSKIKNGYLGDLYNDEFVQCPTDTNTWREWIDSDWKTNLNATLSCHKDTN